MRKFVVLIKFQVFAATGCLALFAIATPPALSQESSTEAVAETIVEGATEGEEPAAPAYTAISAKNPAISTLQLQLLLNPLTAEELTAEADAWQLVLQERIKSISSLELAIEQENDILDVRQDLLNRLGEAKSSGNSQAEETLQRQLTTLDGQARANQTEPRFNEIFTEARSNYALVTGESLVERARKQLSNIEAGEKQDKAAALISDLESSLSTYELAQSKLEEPFFSSSRYEKAQQLAEVRKERLTTDYRNLEKSPLFTPTLANENAPEQIRDQLIAQSTVLETSRANLVTRMQLVLDELEKKGGDIAAYERYISAISGLDFDVTDAQGIKVRLVTWLQSEDGGIKLGLGLLKFGGILAAAFVVAPRVGKISSKLLSKVNGISTLFREFAVISIERSVLVLGGLLALAALGVNLGPILAVVGGASFVLAFALQSNLGNFASGLMLLISKPFDVGDEVQVAGYWAYVDSISLASTKLKDFGGSLITLPNNTVWGGDILNYTHADTRKIKLGLNIKFDQDINQIQALWADVTSSHPNVLKDPGPGSFPWNATYDYHIWIGLSAWAKTDEYWGVYVDLLKALQKRLGEENIELAAPIQTIRLDGDSSNALDKLSPTSTFPQITEAQGVS